MRHTRIALFAALALASAGAAQAQSAYVAPREPMTPPVLQEDMALQAAIASDTRPAADRARDVFRHPYETLTFWGLTPGSTVVEIEPGRGGWWSQILEPYAAATGGTYVAVNRPLEGMQVADGTADLIVVGHKHLEGWAARWWQGAISGALIEHAPCSVLVVIIR